MSSALHASGGLIPSSLNALSCGWGHSGQEGWPEHTVSSKTQDTAAGSARPSRAVGAETVHEHFRGQAHTKSGRQCIPHVTGMESALQSP